MGQRVNQWRGVLPVLALVGAVLGAPALSVALQAVPLAETAGGEADAGGLDLEPSASEPDGSVAVEAESAGDAGIGEEVGSPADAATEEQAVDAGIPAAVDAAPEPDSGPSGFWSFQPTEAPSERLTIAVWMEPLGSAVLAGAGLLYFSFGANVALAGNLDLVAEAAFTTNGNWYGCGTSSEGVWAALGVTYRWGQPTDSNGFFVQPKLHFRYFETRGESSTTWFGCTESDWRRLQDWDADIGIGLDAGYQFKWGPLYVAPIIGFSVGVCLNCLGGTFFQFDFDLAALEKKREKVAFTGALNLNLVRIGIAF